MIVNNEEQLIEDALKSVRWADEIIVVDSESTDMTREIVLRYTDKFFVNKWEGYAPQKRFAMSLASNEWILNIDADERISENLEKEIENLDFNSADGYKIPRKNYFY